MYKNITINIWKTFKNNFLSILKTLILPILILIILSSIVNFWIYHNIISETNIKINQVILFSLMLISILIGIVMLMTIYRGILEDNPENKSFIAFIKAIKSSHIKIFILYSVLTTTFFVIFSTLFLVFFAFITFLIIDNMTIGRIGLTIGLIFAVLIYIRVVLVLPASAIGDKLNLFEAIELTKKYKMLTFYSLIILPFFFSIGLIMLSVIIITLISSTNQSPFILFTSITINAIIIIIIGIFNNICVATLYKQLKRNNLEISDEKTKDNLIEKNNKKEQ